MFHGCNIFKLFRYKSINNCRFNAILTFQSCTTLSCMTASLILALTLGY